MSSLDDELRRELGRHVRQLRTAQHLTLAALAEQVGVSPSALSQIERGKSEPSLGTLWRLGGALKASLFDFFAHDQPTSVDVTRASERTIVEFGRLRYEAIAVSSRRTIDLFVLRLEPGSGPVRDMVRHPGEEAGLVLSGRMEVLVAGSSHRLQSGDGIWFESTEPHTFVSVGDEPCVSVWADTIPEAEGEGDVWSRSLFGPPGQLDGSGPFGGGDRSSRRAAASATDSATQTSTASNGSRKQSRVRREGALAIARALAVSPGSLRDVVEALSAIGSRPDGFRVTGTPEDRLAAERIRDWLRGAGLESVELEHVTVDGWRLGEAKLALAERTIRGASLGGTPGTPAGGLRGRLVDVGTGERRRLDRLELDGRIALLDWHSLSIAPAEVALELGLRGVVGLVLASFEGGPLYQAPGAVGGFDSHWYEGAPPVLTIAKEDAAFLRSQLRGRELLGELTIEIELARDTQGTNVVGWLPGTEPGAPIVIGAHHDAWFRGAFDNATGVAMLIALASGLHRLGHRPRHTFCFTSRTAEEYGLVQSPFDWCAGAWGQISERHPEWGGQSPFHLCLEASGHPQLRTIVEAPVELARWARSVCRAAAEEGWMTSSWRVGPPVTGTEQWPYLLAGVPGVASYCWETSFRRTAYHTPLDTPALVDFEHLARAVRLNALLLLEADADPDAIHDHATRARHLAVAAGKLAQDGERLAAAARVHGRRAGRRAFTSVGRGLHAINAHGEPTYPHAQSAADLARLDEALAAVREERTAAAIKALEAVGSNRLTRVLSAPAFAAHQARRLPGAQRLSWARASHLTASPDLWAELATLRGETGCRPNGPWLEASVVRHREQVAHELRRRAHAMALALQPDPSEAP